MVNNWFVDIYSNSKAVPYSGHADTVNEVLTISYGDRENWPQPVIDAARNSHFESEGNSLSTATGAAREWDRLLSTTGRMARAARDARDPRALLSAIGMSLHVVQDFYSHTNWIEPQGVIGVDGPSWREMNFGNTPTWFDVPPLTRASFNIYAGGAPGHDRFHGGWNADRGRSLATAVAKDWPGRPGYDNAHISAYFATRQWLQAIRATVNNEGFWRRAQSYSDRSGSALDHDIEGATWIGMHSGHWQGQGEPCDPALSQGAPCGARSGRGGNLLELRAANKRYFEGRAKTSFRKQFERGILTLSAKNPTDPPIAMRSSQEMQRTTSFVRLSVLKTRADDLGDAGPDEADMYTRATIAGQSFLSGTINGEDSFSFQRPNAPFEWLKAIPAGATYDEPVTSMQVEVKTSSAAYSGTDDSVYLRINPDMRFALDKRLYDDFERGDTDTYSVPIDTAVRAGLRVGDIKQVQLEKAADGPGGGWKLRGVKLTVNSRVVYQRDGIQKWLENNRRTWTAPEFRASTPRGPALGVTLDIYDDDYAIYGDDDHGDLDPFGMRRAFALNYTPGTGVTRRTTGGDRFSGRSGDGGGASIVYALETLTPVAAKPQGPVVVEQQPTTVQQPTVTTPAPPPAEVKPDLVITTFGYNPALNRVDFTVKNEGAAAAGTFMVSVTGYGTFPVASLAAGASLRIPVPVACVPEDMYEAQADSANSVVESSEVNNTRSWTNDCVL